MEGQISSPNLIDVMKVRVYLLFAHAASASRGTPS